MKIADVRNLAYFKNNLNSNKAQKLSQYPYDSFELSFKGMKKSQFSDIDLMVVELFKAPIEKFKTKEDFDNWANNKIKKEILSASYGGKSMLTGVNRKGIIDDWNFYLSDPKGEYSKHPAWNLLILSSIVKDLKANNDKLPPVLNGGALANTITQIKETLQGNPKAKLSFLKIYNEKLHEIQFAYMDDKTSNAKGKWVKIPSYEHDKEHFSENVEKLKALSHPNWCTSSLQAEPYLREGDFHIYLVNDKPEVGIRFEGDEIVEIEGQRNNRKIPIAYFDEIKQYVKENGFKGLEDEIEATAAHKEEFEKLKADIKPLLEAKDYTAIFNHPAFDCGAVELPNGLYKLNHFFRNDFQFTMQDLGIDENEFMDLVEEIEGDLDVASTDVTRFKNLKTVQGNLDLRSGKVKNTGSIETVGGDLILDPEKVELGERMVNIGGEVEFIDSLDNEIDISIDEYRTNIEFQLLINRLHAAKNKKEIFEALGIEAEVLDDGTLKISNYDKNDIDENLIYLLQDDPDEWERFLSNEEDLLDGVSIIEGNFYPEGSRDFKIKTIKEVYGDVNLSQSKIADLGSIEKIGGELYAFGTNLRSLGNLRSVDGDVDVSYTKLNSLEHLEEIGGELRAKGLEIDKSCF